MACGINVIAALLACATAASAVTAPFPHGKTTVYRYNSVVQSTTTDELVRRFASVFALQGTLNVEHDTRDPELPNAYNVALSNVFTDMYNGDTGEYNGTLVSMPSDSVIWYNPARVILDPFLIIYHPNGTLQGVKIPESEPQWSKNLKLAMASTLQLDLASMNVEKMTDKPDSFVSQEKTIYGDCSVNYDVNPQKRIESSGPEIFSVNKTFTPMKCAGFPLHEFNNVDNGREKERNDESMATESSRLIEVEKQAEGILIKKLDAYGLISVISANAASYPHFVITNTTFELLQVKEKSEANTPLGNFADVPVIRDFNYRCSRKSYAPGAAIDVTEGRRVVNLTDLVYEVSEMLPQAVDYLEENHATAEDIDFNRAGVINKMLHKMSFMDVESLDRVSFVKETEITRVEKIQTIYLGLVSQVGTTASYRYARKAITSNNIPAPLAIDMLGNLPLSIKMPTTELLAEMEVLARLTAPTHNEVRKAGILSFAALVYKTFKNVADPGHNPVLNKYLQEFADRVMTEPTIEMKVVCLMALRNIQVGKVVDLLEPIVDGSVQITEDPERIRLLAIWAIDKALEGNYATAKRVLWPVMENATLPTKLRVAAYEILMIQAPTKEDALAVHQYISSQDNRHFYHYHYTNLDSLAKTVDKKHENLRVVINSIFETANYPPKGQEDIRYSMSGVDSVRFVDDHFWHSEKIDLGMVVNEFTGLPDVLRFEHTVTDKNGAISNLAIQVLVEGHHHFIHLIQPMYEHGLKHEAIRNLLEKAAKSAPALKDLKLDVILSRSGRVLVANHYDFDNLNNISDDLIHRFFVHDRTTISLQDLTFDRLYEKHVTSENGFPVMIEDRTPILRSMWITTKNLNKFPADWDLAMQLKSWQFADHSMSVYNPIRDTWQAIRSVADIEVNFPLSLKFKANNHGDTDSNNPPGIRISFPQLPSTISSVAGFVDKGKHMVTVDENGAEALAESCPICSTEATVSDFSVPLNYAYGYRESSTSHDDLGLEVVGGYRPCEPAFGSELHLGYGPQWNTTFDSNVSGGWTDGIVKILWTVRGFVNSHYLELQTGNCGISVRLQPSAYYSVSHFNIALHGKYEDSDKNETNVYLHADKWTFGATIDAVEAATNMTSYVYKFDLDTDQNRGHLARKFALQLSREAAGKQKMKICFDAKKNYPVPPEDELKIGTTKEEIDSKLTVAWGLTDGDECVRDQSVITVKLKAQPSDEQKKRWKHDLENSDCAKDRKNPSLSAANNMVPRTYNCMNEAIRYTTPRKYTFDVAHEKLKMDFAAFVYGRITQGREPRETGNIQFNVGFAMDTNGIDFEWMTDTSETFKKSIYLNETFFGTHGPTLNTLWDFPMDNSRFSMYDLYQYTINDLRMCSVYPKMTMTGDGENVPFDIPTDQWTLISGDHIDKQFAIFAKQTKPGQLSFVIAFKSYIVHFYNRESDNVFVAKASGVDKEIEESFRLPEDTGFVWNLRMRKQNDRFVINLRSLELELPILMGPNFMSIMMDDNLQGHVSGLCGHLNGTRMSSAPEVYLMPEIA